MTIEDFMVQARIINLRAATFIPLGKFGGCVIQLSVFLMELFETIFTKIVPHPVLPKTSGRFAPVLLGHDLSGGTRFSGHVSGCWGLPQWAAFAAAPGYVQRLNPGAALGFGRSFGRRELAGGVVARGRDPSFGEFASWTCEAGLAQRPRQCWMLRGDYFVIVVRFGVFVVPAKIHTNE